MSSTGFPQGHKDFQRYLDQSVGYGVVIGLGGFFALLMVVLTRLQKRFTQLNPDQAEEFVSASQSIKPGLICCGIVSAWTWSATLLQSSSATYSDGVSAAWWYGVGGTIQITFFAAVAAKVKQNASGAVTFPQIVKARYGTPTFLLFTFYALLCAHTVTGALILGASASINSLTGANIIACNFLLPAGIAIYVVAGGLRATFLVDYLHTAILFIVIYVFVFVIYGTSDIVGSPGKLWDLLQKAATLAPAAGNAAGSYTTLKSNPGIVFAANSICSGFGGVFCDQGYWQRAIASRPESTSRAYVLGGLAWFSIPWVFGTVMGLTGRALLTDPRFPTFPYALSSEQVGAGLVAPATAVTVMGTGGAVAVLLVVFMAATSATSAELIAVSSIITFDVCGVLWKPIRGKQAVVVSHIVIVVFATWAGAWSTILYKVNINLGWLYYVQGVFLAPAVFPIAMTVVWKRQSKSAAFFGTLIGTVSGLIGWFVGCWKIYGAINITNLALPYSAISGEAPGLVCSTLGSIVITFLHPDNFDWSTTRAVTISESDALDQPSTDGTPGKRDVDEGPIKELATASVEVPSESDRRDVLPIDESSAEAYRAGLQRAVVRSTAFSLVFALVVGILIPLPMFFTEYLFSRRFFEVWVGLSIVWALVAGGFCIILPLWESRKAIELLALNATPMVKALYAKDSSR